jgi:hypothetical protein
LSRFQIQVAARHSVLFLADIQADGDVPEDTSAAIVTATDEVICFWTKPEVDGETLVIVSDEDCDLGGVECFKGTLRTPGKVIAVSTSTGFPYLNVPVATEQIDLRIWSSDLDAPEWTWIKVPIDLTAAMAG